MTKDTKNQNKTGLRGTTAISEGIGGLPNSRLKCPLCQLDGTCERWFTYREGEGVTCDCCLRYVYTIHVDVMGLSWLCINCMPTKMEVI